MREDVRSLLRLWGLLLRRAAHRDLKGLRRVEAIEGEGVARPLARVAAERGVGEAAEGLVRDFTDAVSKKVHDLPRALRSPARVCSRRPAAAGDGVDLAATHGQRALRALERLGRSEDEQELVHCVSACGCNKSTGQPQEGAQQLLRCASCAYLRTRARARGGDLGVLRRSRALENREAGVLIGLATRLRTVPRCAAVHGRVNLRICGLLGHGLSFC